MRAYDLIHFAQERYISMSPNDHWVPGARAVNFNDAEITAALPESPFRAEIPQLLRRAHETLYNPTVKPRRVGDHSMRRNFCGPRPNFLIQRQTAARCLPSSRDTSATLPS